MAPATPAVPASMLGITIRWWHARVGNRMVWVEGEGDMTLMSWRMTGYVLDLWDTFVDRYPSRGEIRNQK